METSPDFVERVSDRSRVARSVRRTLELSVLSGKDCQVEFTEVVRRSNRCIRVLLGCKLAQVVK